MQGSGKTSRAFLFISFIGMAGLSGLSSFSAHAQSSVEMQDRLERLETDVRTLNRAVYSQGGSQGSAYSGDGTESISGADAANAEVRVQQLEMELRTMTGQIEQQTYEIRQLKEQLERVTSDMELRLHDLEARRNTPVAESPAAKYTTNPPQPAIEPPLEDNVILDTRRPAGTKGAREDGALGTITQDAYPSSGGPDHAAAAYENAFALLKSSNFDAAEKEFGKFLDQYPDHILSSNAKYWYGETFYVRGEFERAARIFAESYQQAPRGAKAQDNLLKLGMSLAGMGNTKDACVALKQLDKENPGAATPVLRRGQQEMQRLGC